MVYSQQDTLIYKYRRMSVDYRQQIKMAEADFASTEAMVDGMTATIMGGLFV